MSVGTKDSGKLAESAFSERTVEVAGDKKAGKTLEVNVLYRIPIHFFRGMGVGV
jgi:hypothetical protein